ncbi:MAG: YybH family protein [Acidobacteriota bacterium]
MNSSRTGRTSRSRVEESAALILECERSALEKWASGNPAGYFEGSTLDMTYFDDIGAGSRIDGIEALRAYAASLQGSIPAHTFDLSNTRVQVYGSVGILTFLYLPFDLDGTHLAPWKATTVYRRFGDQWRRVHANWSEVKRT